jgi:hypothetical protein
MGPSQKPGGGATELLLAHPGTLEVWRLGGLEVRKTGGLEARAGMSPSQEPIERVLEIQEAWKLGNLEVWRLGGLEARKTGGLEAGRLGGSATELLWAHLGSLFKEVWKSRRPGN